jgi:hypothetical protein
MVSGLSGKDRRQHLVQLAADGSGTLVNYGRRQPGRLRREGGEPDDERHGGCTREQASQAVDEVQEVHAYTVGMPADDTTNLARRLRTDGAALAAPSTREWRSDWCSGNRTAAPRGAAAGVDEKPSICGGRGGWVTSQ